MTFYSVSNPFMQVLNLQGTGLNDGDVYFGVAGQDPITHPKVVYWDIAGTDVAAQPIETSGGYLYRDGTPANVYLDSTYSIKVLDKKGGLVYYEANVFDPVFQIAEDLAAFEAELAGPTGSSLIGYTGGISGVAATTAQAKLREFKSVKADFGAVGDGATDDTAAFSKAATYANSVGGKVTIWIPDGRYKITAAVTPCTVAVGWTGSSSAGAIIEPTYNGPVFEYTSLGVSFENFQISYPSAPPANAVVFYSNGGDSANFRNLRVSNIRTLYQAGKSDGSTIGNAANFSQIKGNVYNSGSPCFNLYSGAGLLLNDVGIYVAGVANPAVNRTSSMTTVSGTSLIKANGYSFDTISISGGSVFERWWRVLDIVTTAGGGNVLNMFVDNSTICDYISEDVYHLETVSSGGAIINSKLAGYASSWSGRAVNIVAIASIGDIDILDLVIPFSGYEGIRLAGAGWRDIRIDKPKAVASNRIAAGNSAGIRAQDSGSGHLTILEARAGIDGAAGGSPWQATYGISLGADLNNFAVADCDCQGATGFYDFASNTAPSGNRRIRDNINADYSGFKTGGIYVTPADTVPWTNTTGFEIDVYVEGGTLTSIRKNGVLTGLLSGMLTVLPGDNFTLFGTVGTAHFYVKP